MTPSKSLTSLTGTPGRKTGLSLHSSANNSRTSLSSSHGSSQSITSQGQPRFGSERNLGSMTPTEALIQSATGSVNHSRTPSQTLVMEHLQQEITHFEEETYVDMNEDGSFLRLPRSTAARELRPALLARQGKKESLDTTLTPDSAPESPRYCEIEEPDDNAHYEYLYKARTPQHYEVLYQEIEEQHTVFLGGSSSTGTIRENKRKQNKKKEPEPLRPIEGLPDILGNAPTKGNSSSDADDESSKDFDIELRQQMITLDDSFRPASFYLSHSKASITENGDDSSDSDLVSPPPVPSSPPPMEEVLGYHSAEVSDLSNILSAAKSTLNHRHRRESAEDINRRPSVGSRTSYGSQGSQQSLNRESSTMSPLQQRLHGSHQSLSSRELPPIPGQSQLGSQQSLASKEIQSIGSRTVLDYPDAYRNSPFHSREGSLDNELFLYHRFTQGSSLGDPYRKQSSDELSSDTALYEQEYRRYHLENILEVSNTLERNDSHNTSVISQDLNISYNSVYDTRLQQSKVYKIEDHPALKKRKSLDERQTQVEQVDQPASRTEEDTAPLSPRSKVPYYVSDIIEDDYEEAGDQMVEAITKSMNALDVESKSYFETKNEAENERIKKWRRSYTPDPYLTKSMTPVREPPRQEVQQVNNVSRSKSLEGLLGDSQGSARDNLGYPTQPKVYSPHNFNDISSQPRPARGLQPPPPPEGVPPLDIRQQKAGNSDVNDDDDLWADTLRRASLRQQKVQSPCVEEERGRQPGVSQSPVKLKSPQQRSISRENQASPNPRYPHMYKDERGRQSVPTVLNNLGHQSLLDGRQSVPPHSAYREAEQQHSAYREAEQQQRAKLPPPTAPKPKTPVHFAKESSDLYSSFEEPVRRNATVYSQHHLHSAPTVYSQHHLHSAPTVYNQGPHHSGQADRYANSTNLSNPQHQSTEHHSSQHFLEVGLPSPISNQGPGRLDPTRRSQTLPSRVRYSDSSSSRYSSQEPEDSPRTSKSGLYDTTTPTVPPCPITPTPEQQQHKVTPTPEPQQHTGYWTLGHKPVVHSDLSYKPVVQSDPLSNDTLLGRQILTDAPGPETRQRRRSISARRSSDLDNLKKKLGGSLSNMTAGDLLGKTQEELVLLLIQLRRQAASLQETVDACKAELDNMRNTGEQGGVDLREHTWELEEQLARLLPVISLVDNMVKLGTLYRGNNRTNNKNNNSNNYNLNSKANKTLDNNINKAQELMEHRLNSSRDTGSSRLEPETDFGGLADDQINLQRELVHVQNQLKSGLKKLDENSCDLANFERDIFQLRQELRVSVERDRGRGRETTSQETLEIEGHLRNIQGRAMDLERRRGEMVKHIHQLRGQESLLSTEIRPSPTGVVGAESVPSKKRSTETWLETDIDTNRTLDRGPDTRLRQETMAESGAVYMNTCQGEAEEDHNYENCPGPEYENYRAELERNPYEDDVQTVHSEGVRSEYDSHPPPVPDRPPEEVILGLGELSEADERVQRYYGIIPREKPSEIKTVRMVKRDHKERLSKGRRGDEDSESVELSLDEEEPPLPLPRGNYATQHSFLSHPGPETGRSFENGGESGAKPQFKLGEYYRRQESCSGSRPGSALSAHERLFGVSRDESISPDMSPAKSSLASSDSTQSALMSPVFKSAAARAIIEEERKTPMIIPKAKKKNKKRHMTITSSHPAVLEAINRHEKIEANRSRDDLDMERMLKPRDAPDVVRSTYGQENDIRETSIDNLFGAPNKIRIPERYVPDQERVEATPEERQTRLKKADSIRRMLAGTTVPVVQKRGEGERGEDRRARDEREQLLALNQVLARQVMERSRLVAGHPPES